MKRAKNIGWNIQQSRDAEQSISLQLIPKKFKKTLAMHFGTIIVGFHWWGSFQFHPAFGHCQDSKPFSGHAMVSLPSLLSALQTSVNLSQRQFGSRTTIFLDVPSLRVRLPRSYQRE